MEKINIRKRMLFAALPLLLVICAISVAAANLIAKNNKEIARYEAEAKAKDISRIIESYVQNLNVWGALLDEYGENVIEEDFDELAENIYGSSNNIRCIQMAPGGVVTYLHPYEGNEEALGHDLFADPARVEEATLARETGEIILSGPLTLKQGGKGLISRKPIYSSVSDEPDHFWGFVMIVLDLDMINEQFGLEKYTYEGYDYRLYREYGDEILIATESTDSELTDAVEVDVAVPTIMDIMMPEMDGLTATRAIRSMKRADMQTIPIIAMMAHAFAEDRKAAIEAGMNGYVTKPIDVAMLIEEIRTVMLS